MPTLLESGTQSATIGTEHTLSTVEGAAIFLLVVDTGAMMNGSGGTPADQLELSIKTICLAGGTEREAYVGYFVGVQKEPVKFSVPVPSDISIRFTLKQVDGTGRSYPWKVLLIE